jgi:hypothetical protein
MLTSSNRVDCVREMPRRNVGLPSTTKRVRWTPLDHLSRQLQSAPCHDQHVRHGSSQGSDQELVYMIKRVAPRLVDQLHDCQDLRRWSRQPVRERAGVEHGHKHGVARIDAQSNVVCRVRVLAGGIVAACSFAWLACSARKRQLHAVVCELGAGEAQRCGGSTALCDGAAAGWPRDTSVARPRPAFPLHCAGVQHAVSNAQARSRSQGRDCSVHGACARLKSRNRAHHKSCCRQAQEHLSGAPRQVLVPQSAAPRPDTRSAPRARTRPSPAAW